MSFWHIKQCPIYFLGSLWVSQLIFYFTVSTIFKGFIYILVIKGIVSSGSGKNGDGLGKKCMMYNSEVLQKSLTAWAWSQGKAEENRGEQEEEREELDKRKSLILNDMFPSVPILSREDDNA